MREKHIHTLLVFNEIWFRQFFPGNFSIASKRPWYQCTGTIHHSQNKRIWPFAHFLFDFSMFLRDHMRNNKISYPTSGFFYYYFSRFLYFSPADTCFSSPVGCTFELITSHSFLGISSSSVLSLTTSRNIFNWLKKFPELLTYKTYYVILIVF